MSEHDEAARALGSLLLVDPKAALALCSRFAVQAREIIGRPKFSVPDGVCAVCGSLVPIQYGGGLVKTTPHTSEGRTAKRRSSSACAGSDSMPAWYDAAGVARVREARSQQSKESYAKWAAGEKLKSEVQRLQRAGILPTVPTREQRIDFAYGNARASNSDVTIEMAIAAVDKEDR